MGKVLDLSDKRFGSLVAKFPTKEKTKNGSFIWLCECDCGNTIELATRVLVHNGRKNCGCTGRKVKNHGLSKTSEYVSWQNMLARCRRNIEYYEDVEVCERWDTYKGGSFENFFEDMGKRPEGSTLNRVSGAKIYSKETCEWTDTVVQSYDQKRRKDNISGKTGVSWNLKSSKWEARIGKGNKIHILGLFVQLEDAIKARESAEIELFGFSSQG